MEFIAVNQELADQFEEKMARNKLFRSTDNFVDIYNSNLINKSNEDVKEIASEIGKVYKNVELVGKQFVVKSKEEVVSDEFKVIFPHISFIATLKRIAGGILEENYPDDTMLVFTEDKKNDIQIYDPSLGSEELKVYDGAEKIRDIVSSIAKNPFLLNAVELQNYGENGIAFKAIDVMTIDTSFISEIGELIELHMAESSNQENEQESYQEYNSY